jgi:hypothetical protein
MKVKAIEAMTAYDEMRVAFEKFNHPDPVDGIGVPNATGMTLYAPSVSTDYLYGDLALAATDWYSFGAAARIVRPTTIRERGPVPTYIDSAADNDTLADSVKLIWPEVYQEHWIWVYRHEPGGYSLLGMVVSESGVVTLSSWFGDLMLSAYATSGGSARTYDVLNITLYGTLVATIHIEKDGQTPKNDYEVRVAMQDMTWYYVAVGGVATLNLSVPTQIGIGEMLSFEVVSPGSDVVLGGGRAVLPDHDFSLEVSIYSQPKETSGLAMLLVFSALPGALVLVFALMLYREGGKRKDR